MRTEGSDSLFELLHTERFCPCGAPFSIVEWKPGWRGPMSDMVNGPIYKLQCPNGHYGLLADATTSDVPVTDEPSWRSRR